MQPHQLLLVSASTTSKVTAVESLVEVPGHKQQWLMVENCTHLPAHVKKGDKVAYVSSLEETYEIPEEMLREGKAEPEEATTLILNSLDSELDSLSLTEMERQEKLATSLNYTNPNLLESEKERRKGFSRTSNSDLDIQYKPRNSQL